ncbi:hypothetical protein FHL15_008575 [Xylaria flabelliformis]|uniref:Ecp2 effector protein-like domain-containing protein n=1 Tax=Xylaria flabelliformis TaxID=2512241 RepID=A0A553HRM6_9PEZI|nr:hypothetical protein FHL15_008575 [Xylaria flabelliformis]
MHLTSLVSAALALACGVYSIPKHFFEPLDFATGSVCDDTSWNLNSNARVPLVSDCEKLEQEMQNNRKKGFKLYGWQQDKDDAFLPIVFIGSCVFGVKVLNANNAPAIIANGDIADILHDAIRSYTNGNQVSAVMGDMTCRAYWGDYSQQGISWSIYNW